MLLLKREQVIVPFFNVFDNMKNKLKILIFKEVIIWQESQ